jgi:Protein of unknown function (DUF2959)
MKRICTACLVIACVLSGALAALPACASSPDTAGTASAMDSFALEMAKVNDSIDGATQALKTLMQSTGENVKSSFTAFSNSVKVVDARASNVRARADEMKTRGDEYFKAWESGSDTGMSKERHAELTSAYGKIKEEMLSAKEAFGPYLASLKDIQKLLSLDLTPQGLASAEPLASRAQADAADVKSRIKAVSEQVNAVSGHMSKKPAG